MYTSGRFQWKFPSGPGVCQLFVSQDVMCVNFVCLVLKAAVSAKQCDLFEDGFQQG